MWGPLMALSARLGPSVPFLDSFTVFYISNALVSSALPDSIEVGVYSWHSGRRNRHLVHCLFCRLTFWRCVVGVYCWCPGSRNRHLVHGLPVPG